MNKRKRLTFDDKSLQEVRITELDDGNMESILGGAAAINVYDCTNPTSCGGETNLWSCNNERVCLMDT